MSTLLNGSYYKIFKDTLDAVIAIGGGLEDWVNEVNLALSALDGHEHVAADITDFASAVDSRIENIVGAAPAALDTLEEIAAALGDDEDFAATMVAALSNKVDKVTGKGLSENDLTNALKSKLDALPDPTTLENRIAALEAWKTATGIKRIERFTGTTNGNGDVSVTLSNTASDAAKVVYVANCVYASTDHDISFTVRSRSTTGATIRFHRSLTLALLGSTVAAHTSAAVEIIAIEFN